MAAAKIRRVNASCTSGSPPEIVKPPSRALNNPGGVAVSGEITLHYDAVYIQVSQPATGHDSGILIRRCKGRRDYTGERNHFESLSLLEDLPALAQRVSAVLGSEVRP